MIALGVFIYWANIPKYTLYSVGNGHVVKFESTKGEIVSFCRLYENFCFSWEKARINKLEEQSAFYESYKAKRMQEEGLTK